MLQVPQYVVDAVIEVGDSGETNMFDRPRVIQIMSDTGKWEAANWLLEHKKDYGHIIFGDFEIEEDK